MAEDGLFRVNNRVDLAFQKIEKLERKSVQTDRELVTIKNAAEWQEREIKSIMNDIKEIHNDTRWLRRSITGAIIAAVSTGLIGGLIGVLWTVVGK